MTVHLYPFAAAMQFCSVYGGTLQAVRGRQVHALWRCGWGVFRGNQGQYRPQSWQTVLI